MQDIGADEFWLWIKKKTDGLIMPVPKQPLRTCVVKARIDGTMESAKVRNV